MISVGERPQTYALDRGPLGPALDKYYYSILVANGAADVVTRLRTGQFGVLSPVEARYFCLLQDIQTDSK
jgi:hypothetical protein